MAIYAESRGRITEAEPVGLLTEGAAGIAVIVLSVIALAGIAVEGLVSIATIVIGVGLMVQAFNSAAEHAKAMTVGAEAGARSVEPTGDVMADCLCGVTGIVLGILALVGINAAHLVPAALIVFGGSLLLSGAMSMGDRGSAAAGGMEILIGMAAIVLGILSLILMASSVLVLVGFIAVGAAMLLVSASFSGAMMRLLTAA
ncbi:MAG: hypothetical protein ACREFI_14610 [Stellaceae bacterium]